MIKLRVKKYVLIGAIACLISLVVLTLLTRHHMRPLPSNLDTVYTTTVKPQLLDRNGQALTITYQNEWNSHDLRPLHRIPPRLQQAFILAEDKRFYEHSGIDWIARLNAVWQNLMALDGVRGASTISEQVVRMIHQRPRSIWAKWLEGWEARELESKVDKASILEFYLNQVPYAAQRRGVQQASNYYFDRDISTLNLKEMLALAVLVRAPSYFDLHKSTKRLNGRLEILLDRAHEAGMVDDVSRVKNTDLILAEPTELLNISHFASHIYQHANPNQKQIRTTLDSHYQNVAQKLLNERLAILSKRKVANAGMIVVDHQSDEVLVWAVGETSKDKASDYDTILVQRQPGSTLKPFVYASAMEKGWTAATMIDDSPLTEGVGQGAHSYRNYSNSHYGKLSLRKALGNSLNIPAIKAAQYVGVEPLIDTLNKLGIQNLDLRSVDYGNGIALGNAEISLHSLVGAYSTLARQGVYRPLKTSFDQGKGRERSVFSPQVSSIIGNILSDPNARALEFSRGGTLNLPVQTAVKTGTSNDYRDAWVVGYNHRYVVGIWMGNLDNQAMDEVTGSNGPAFVLRSMFAELNRDSETKPLFLSRTLERREICIESGLEKNTNCSSRSEWFRTNTNISKSGISETKQATKRLESSNARIEDQQIETESYLIAHPVDQMLVARDPRIPDHMEALEFKLNITEGFHSVDWLVNNVKVASTNTANYQWPLEAGKHIVQALVYESDSTKPVSTQAVVMQIR